MGWFNKKQNEEDSVPTLPKLPELPKLPGYKEFPEIPKMGNTDFSQKSNLDLPEFKDIHQLPSIPSTSFGEKFSQSTIKNAITGQKEDEEDEANEFENYQMMQNPPEKISEEKKAPLVKETPSFEFKSREKTTEPVFIRIDKFEESLRSFEKIKTKISEIEKLLSETKDLKDKEQVELNNWGEEIQKLKSQIEKINEDIFSKIE